MMFGGAGAAAEPASQRAHCAHDDRRRPTTPARSTRWRRCRIAVAAGAEVGNINFAVQSVPAFRVSGTVVDENGNPVAGAMVMLMGDPRNGGMFMGPSGSARTQDNGRFDMDDVPAGTYRANASTPVMGAGSGVSGVVSGGVSSSVTVSGSGGGGFVFGDNGDVVSVRRSTTDRGRRRRRRRHGRPRGGPAVESRQ